MKIVDIEGFPGYAIREDGTVFNSEGKELKQGPTSRGYIRVFLNLDGKQKTCTVHRLVATAFIPNEEGYSQIDHIDEDKLNNHVSNLRWCTPKMNINYYTGKRKHLIKPKKTTQSMEEFIQKTSKMVVVNGKEFVSIREAARFIANKENKSIDTIRKELRNFVNGKRPSWWMYGKYKISKYEE